MKQHITIEQLNELSEKTKDKLKKWWDARYTSAMDGMTTTKYTDATSSIFGVPVISIGQMIEFLDWDDMEIYRISKGSKHPKADIGKWIVQDGDYENAGKSYLGDSICDSLWEAVKEILEK